MNHLLIMLILICTPCLSIAQQICFLIDSVEVYRIPWRTTSNFNIHKNEIIHSEVFSTSRSEHIIKDTSALKHFAEAKITSESRVLSFNENVDNIDARAVLVIHYSNIVNDTIVLNRLSSYFYRNRVYTSNLKLLIWLAEYNPLHNPNSDFFKENEIEQLKEKHNYMIDSKK